MSEINQIDESTISKTYTFEQALEKSVEYFNGDELAANVFVSKYALVDNFGRYCELTPEQMHRRIAKELARIESKYENSLSEDEIFNLVDRFKYIVPQGSPMSGIGNPFRVVSLSNCYVVPSPLDSYGGILHTDQEAAQIYKRRGGVGFDISNIRPKGMKTNNAARTTDGIGVFMERFSNSCREVAMQGRRGALMLTISVHHPEIETFINIKKDKTKVTGANVSIRVSDEFMNAVRNDEEYELRFPVESKTPTIIKKVKAKEVWDNIIDGAWNSAEPGIIFWDTASKNTPANAYDLFKSTSTNPCSEILLSPYDSCRLMVVNLFNFVENPFTDKAVFNFELYKNVCRKAQRLMDDLIDLELECIDNIISKVENDPEPEHIKKVELDLWRNIKSACFEGRRTGLGITALGDTLAALNLRYGSEESINITRKIYKNLAVSAYAETVKLAKERGAFPHFNLDTEKDHIFISKIIKESNDEFEEDVIGDYVNYGRRNIALTTTAPTGSVSMLTQTTSGIEPAFMLKYDRFKKVNPGDPSVEVNRVDANGDAWQKFTVYHHHFKTWMDVSGKSDVEDSPYYKATANDVNWISSVDIQAAAQEYICHAISKTCNLPKEATKDLVSEVYMRAWEMGCKGFTVYRDGCRDGVLVASDNIEKDENNRPVSIVPSKSPKRPKELFCDIHQPTIKGQKWTVLVGLLDGVPYEMFTGYAENLSLPSKCITGKLIKQNKGIYNLHVDVGDEDLIIRNVIKTFDNKESAWATRMVSIALRHGVPLVYAVEQLNKDGAITDVNKVLARILKKYIKDGEDGGRKSCPSCGSDNLKYDEGCLTCLDCGNSKCG